MAMSALIFLTGLTVLALLALAALAGPSPAKAGQRRLQAVRLRHAGDAGLILENQLKKAIAARRPGSQRADGSRSRADALALRLERTGMNWTLGRYLQVNAALAATVALLIVLNGGTLFLALCAGVLAGVGVPHLVVSRLVKRRLAAFVARFPEAIELLVRGLRSGLPIAETLGVVAREVPGPVGAEFRAVVERIKIGRTMEDALQVTADRLDMPEFQFFVITLGIQRETGGNLAETLSNLADVLRKRAQMKLKIRALSSESKASAMIVGALPFLVFGMIWWISPDYLGGFFVDPRLVVTGLGGLVWMALGVFIMSRMVSFEI